MSILDDADSFRSCPFEDYEGVNYLPALTENSVSLYSRAQTERQNKARQRISKKIEQRDAVGDKESVEITISEDLTDGQSARLDAALNLLGEEDIELLLPNDELKDEEVHIIEISRLIVQPTSESLIDYQMQPMLLEQQNLKRLMIARREQEVKSKPEGLKKKQSQIVITQKPFQKLQAIQSSPIMLATGTEGTVPAAKRRKRDRQTRTQFGKSSNDDIFNENDSNAAFVKSIEVGDCL